MKTLVRKALFFLVPLVLIGCGIYCYLLWHFSLVVRHVDLYLPLHYERLDGCKIVLFSDLHMLDTADDLKHFREIVQWINAEKPDFIFFTGDLIATDNVEWHLPPSRIITRMRMLQAKYGVYAVTGNHDWYSGDGETICREWRQVGIHVLDNSSVTIPGVCNLVGVQDETGPDGVKQTAAMAKVDPDLPTIALIHRPEYWDGFPESVKLFFAGHTHGGQIRLPYLREILLKHNGEEKYPDYDYFSSGNRQLHITSGIGTSWIRVRINCPPEIRVFHCRKGKK